MSRRVGDTTMLFKPLAYASALDRCGHCRYRASSWRRSGARRSLRRRNSQTKAADIWAASITAFRRARTFLSQAGPRFSPWFSSSWASPRCGRCLAFKRRRRPSRVALASSCYAARGLAGAPPSEGLVVVGQQQAERPLPARRTGRDIGRGRWKRLDVGVAHQHWSVLCRVGT